MSDYKHPPRKLRGRRENTVKLDALETFTQGGAKVGFQRGVCKTQEFILALLFLNDRLIFHRNDGQPTLALPGM